MVSTEPLVVPRKRALVIDKKALTSVSVSVITDFVEVWTDEEWSAWPINIVATLPDDRDTVRISISIQMAYRLRDQLNEVFGKDNIEVYGHA
jgi:hypothetical protein